MFTFAIECKIMFYRKNYTLMNNLYTLNHTQRKPTLVHAFLT